MEKQKITIFDWANLLFGGIGTSLLTGIYAIINKFFNTEWWKNNKHNVLIYAIYFLILAFIWFVQIRFTRKTNKYLEEVQDKVGELTTASEIYVEKYKESRYICKKYEEADEFYKKLSSIVKANKIVDESFIVLVLDKIRLIVAENTNEKNSKINVTLFEKIEPTKDSYTIKFSTYHTQGTIEKLKLGRKSFVNKIFKEKTVGYIADLSNLSRDDRFVEIEGRKYKTIMGIPYVVDGICEYVLIITTEKRNSLSEIYDKYMTIIQQYTQIIGILTIMRRKGE